MTADQIKKTLKPFADFAPAILLAADIVAEAEQAEKRTAEAQKLKADTEKEIVALTERRKAAEADLAKAHDTQRKALADHQDVLAGLKESLTPLRQDKAKLEQEIQDAVTVKNNIIAAKNDEIAEKNKQLAKVQAEIDRLKKQFAA